MLVICLLLLQTVLLQADGAILTPSPGGVGSRFACPNITLSCAVDNDINLQWVISESNPITFIANNQPGTSRIQDSFLVNLTEVSRLNALFANFTSVLSIENVDNLRGNPVVVQCIDSTETARFNLSVEELPDSPASVSVENAANVDENATIAWSPPLNSANFDIFEYEVLVTGPGPSMRRNSSTTATQITFNGLSSGNYSVSVMAITQCGTRSPSNSTTFSVATPDPDSSLAPGVITGIVIGCVAVAVVLLVQEI